MKRINNDAVKLCNYTGAVLVHIEFTTYPPNRQQIGSKSKFTMQTVHMSKLNPITDSLVAECFRNISLKYNSHRSKKANLATLKPCTLHDSTCFQNRFTTGWNFAKQAWGNIKPLRTEITHTHPNKASLTLFSITIGKDWLYALTFWIRVWSQVSCS